MGSWADGPFVGFDTETTGVRPQEDRVVTAAVVHRGAGGSRTRTWLVDPGVAIPATATAVHGVTTAQARAEGLAPAAALAEVARELASAMRAGTPVVAFNAAFDLTLLESELRRHRLSTLADRLGRPLGPVLDPLVLDRALERYRPGKRRLGDLCSIYDVHAGVGLHTAEVDVEATLDVLAALVRRYPALRAMDVDQVHAWQVAAHREWADGFNRWRRRQGLEGPGAGRDWPLDTRRDGPGEEVDVRRVRAASVVPGVHGALAREPDLRAVG